ncbi:hypothetical protein Patl1_21364 [Pistacia atlantica]|uniref:Uncharacterized protein n=1 Tax=Pistacia atlantica TaxID=434234 RepID=A0ACC1BJH1_9ROSI|nr:hypothetical protein Patl1_21364 [Pistacia atlantica]
MGWLQNYLMNKRPGFVLGMIVIVALSVVVSIGFLLLQVVDIAKIVLFGFHLM